jgi:L-ascorbate metabolism protein UlaG (beta-lactamase superfamily)
LVPAADFDGKEPKVAPVGAGVRHARAARGWRSDGTLVAVRRTAWYGAMAEFRWYGHNCFRIKGREATVITDPVGRATGYAMPKQTADVVTISHEHPGHANLGAVRPDYQVVRGPGEYEMHDIFITGIRTYHDDQRGAESGYNTVYLIEIEGMVICHLGDLGHALTEEQAEAMSNVDVLLVPAGGGKVLDPPKAAEVIAQLEPKVVIPMQYATTAGDTGLGDLAAFCKHLGVDSPNAEEKLLLRESELTEAMRLVALVPESEPARR